LKDEHRLRKPPLRQDSGVRFLSGLPEQADVAIPEEDIGRIERRPPWVQAPTRTTTGAETRVRSLLEPVHADREGHLRLMVA
jgi:hypothetical protein